LLPEFRRGRAVSHTSGSIRSADFFRSSAESQHPGRVLRAESAKPKHIHRYLVCETLLVLHLDQLAPATPQLPQRRGGVLMQLAASAAVHLTMLAIVAVVSSRTTTAVDPDRVTSVAAQEKVDVRHIVFLAPDARQIGGGGGGGGNQQRGPIRHAQGVGSDAITLRVRKSRPEPPIATDSPGLVDDTPPLPSIVLEAKPLASGTFDEIGLPVGGVPSGTSTGPGSGGGVGTGIGTGIGSGRGPGLGPGSGGGVGGGAYRPGGAVTAPRVLTQVKPKYTSDALLRKIQGTVVLDVIVTRDGRPSEIRVIRSLDPGGLDEQAVTAVTQWRFEPGRLAGTPVDVLVTVMFDFLIR
jgi:periplasmic protein TonB